MDKAMVAYLCEMFNKIASAMPQKDQDLPTGRVNYSKASMTSPNKAGTPTKSPHNVGGINKPMGDGLTKPQTQWTKRS